MSTEKKSSQDNAFQRVMGRYTFKSDDSDRTPSNARSPTDQEKMCSSSLADHCTSSVVIPERQIRGLQIIQSLETINQRKGFGQDTQRKRRNRHSFAGVVGEELLQRQLKKGSSVVT